MSWLLQWAGVNVSKPWWDQWLLVATGLLVVLSFLPVVIIGGDQPWSRLRWTAVSSAYITLLGFIYYASRWMEQWQLRQNIERWRRGTGSFVRT